MNKAHPIKTILFLCLLGALFISAASSTINTPAPNKGIKVVVFDFGGVIGRTDKKQMASFIANELGITQQEAVKAMHQLKHTLKQGGQEEVFWADYFKKQGKKMPADWYERLDIGRIESLKALPGMVEIAKQLKQMGYGPALLSNTRDSQAKIKRQLGYYDLFSPVLLSNEIGVAKPHPQAYKILLNRLQLPPEALFFVDDHEENVAAAKSLGIDSVYFQNPKQFVDELAKRGIYVTLPAYAASLKITDEERED
ncbi:MAG: HAD family phosphatase [Parachlamydia sp.]|jgi:putative hydrolase of the HAD superfamily|nr:HAD family phosphatase [Parachlamydia sp.]